MIQNIGNPNKDLKGQIAAIRIQTVTGTQPRSQWLENPNQDLQRYKITTIIQKVPKLKQYFKG